MKSFFKTFLAALLALAVGTMLVFFVTMGIVGALMASEDATYEVKDNSVLKLELSGSLADRSEPSPFAFITGEGQSMTVEDVTSAIEKAGKNEKIKGIYLKAGWLGSSFANLEPVRKALTKFKETGKFIVAYGESYSNGTYYLSSLADKVIMNPKGSMGLTGIGGVLEFKKNQLDKLGISYQVFKVGTFKSAVEPYIQTKMSEPNRLQTESYMNSIWSHMLNGIAESRNLTVEKLNEYADEAIMFAKPEEVIAKGMVDTLMYEVDVPDYMASLMEVDKAKDITQVSLKNMKKIKEKPEKKGKNKIAVLYAEGSIVDDGFGGMPFMSGGLIQPKDYVFKMKELMEDEDVKAVVFRVNSGGGSANASEQIWHSVKELNAVKPVIVSMGGAAASGGYYISAAATSIVAEPTTITGSIGIFGLLPNGEELAKKMGLTFEEVGTNKFSTMGGTGFGIPFLVTALSRGLNEAETALMQNHIEEGYDLFLTRCAEGRSMTKEQIDAVGQGRVWTGAQALEIGLVDQLGGLQDAIALAAEKASIEDYKVTRYPKEKSLMDQLIKESFGDLKLKMTYWYLGEEAVKQKQLEEQLKNMSFRQAIMLDYMPAN